MRCAQNTSPIAARLGVCRLVGQVEVLGEPFDQCGRPEPTGDIHPPRRHVVPEPAARDYKPFVTRLAATSIAPL